MFCRKTQRSEEDLGGVTHKSQCQRLPIVDLSQLRLTPQDPQSFVSTSVSSDSLLKILSPSFRPVRLFQIQASLLLSSSISSSISRSQERNKESRVFSGRRRTERKRQRKDKDIKESERNCEKLARKF
ncbi:hypothetical protein K1719_014485 [Acacia pycnantha]|nr:hypothetical protein K1719_014485 [Acacia pycnantha]